MSLKIKKTLLILNPKAGLNSALKDKPKIEKLLSSHGEYITYLTTGKEDEKHIKLLKNIHPELDTVVVCGGDGTLNLTLNALIDKGMRFIFLPYGTINIFARDHHYPSRPIEALKKILLSGKEKILYPGDFNGRFFMLMQSIGYDSYLVKKVSEKGKNMLVLSYINEFLSNMLKYNFSQKYRIIADNQEYEAHLAIVSNCKHYGGYFPVFPHTTYTEDFFYIFLFYGKNFLDFFLFMAQVIFKIPNKNLFKVIKAKKIRIEGEGITQIDGEKGVELPVEITKTRGVHFVLP